MRAILRKTERATVKATCSRKVTDKPITQEQMGMLELKEAVNELAKSKWSEMVRT